ncbi:hypothetical protein PCH_Pc22g13940 [Penicillium rubens Wisconsin 54-1255]|uniref:Uncharacterized protein n=1 Tax=Penicillium rubens (strain ATCC 28089 / DSM 1075 / NRRL 1951 / Wisconsin 54-1255) TaxID=500485 RepID=B6HU24_PENRW|nr:hypothetical protein PCH_Pc22g13940 [Penicillium rubens Wisconsin 54-1255]
MMPGILLYTDQYYLWHSWNKLSPSLHLAPGPTTSLTSHRGRLDLCGRSKNTNYITMMPGILLYTDQYYLWHSWNKLSPSLHLAPGPTTSLTSHRGRLDLCGRSKNTNFRTIILQRGVWRRLIVAAKHTRKRSRPWELAMRNSFSDIYPDILAE